MSEVKFSEEQLKKLAAQLTARISEAKNAENQNAETEDTVRNMLSDEIAKAMELAEQKRIAAEDAKALERAQRITGQFETGSELKDMNIYGNESPFSYAGKMAMNSHDLKYWASDKEARLIKEAQTMNNNIVILGKLLAFKNRNQGSTYQDEVRGTKLYKAWNHRLSLDEDLRKAINVTTTAQGLELVPTELAANILEQIEVGQVVPSLFETIPMPTNPFKMPVETGEEDAFIITETTADNPANSDRVEAQTPPSSNMTFDATGIGSRTRVSYQATEDAIIALLPWITKRIIKGNRKGLERAIISGDTSATHQDSDTHAGSAKLPEKAWFGLRYYGLNAAGTPVDFANGDPTKALLGDIMLLANEYAAMPNDMVWLVGPKGYTKMRLADIDVFTLEKYGAGAVVRTGELGQWGGSSIIVSRYARENLNATGVYDGVTTNRAAIHYINTQGFLIGDRRSVLTEVDKDIETQQMMVVTSRNIDFKAPWDPTSASYPMVSTGYNLSTV